MSEKTQKLANDFRESELLKAIKDYLTYCGWTVYRINNMGVFNPHSGGYFFHGTPGFPDLVAFRKNYPPLFIEVKGPKGRLTDAQEGCLNLIKSSKGDPVAIVARSLGEVQKVVKRLKKQTKTRK